MTDLAAVMRSRLAENKNAVRVEMGDYEGPEGSQVRVTVGGVVAVMPIVGGWPMPGEQVLCLRVDERWLCFGSAQPRQQWGEIKSVAGGSATVEYPPGSGVTASMLVPTGYVPSVGQKALLDWTNGGVIVQLYGGTPPPPPKPLEPTAPAREPVTRVFRAVDSGSADGNGRWIRSELYARTSPQGAAAWFHGTQIRDAVGTGTVLSARIYMPMASFATGSILLGYHTLGSKSGVPGIALGDVVTAPQGWHTLPLDIAQALADDGRGISLKTNAGGAPAYKSIGQDPMSGQIEMTYR